jgi:DNA-binding NarL/FixJ family response regulator
MKVLVIEQWTPRTQIFIEQLNRAAGCGVYHAQSLDEGLCTMKERHADVIVVNLDEQEQEGWHVAEQIRSESLDAHMLCPYMIFQYARRILDEDARKCWDLDVACMLREWWPAVFEEVRKALWKRRKRRMNSTIRFQRHQGHYTLHHCKDMTSAHICVPFQPVRLAVILAGGLGAYTVQSIADDLGLCCQSVKKYIWELREGDLQAQRELNIIEPDRDVFWMERKAGGTLAGIRANIIWI